MFNSISLFVLLYVNKNKRKELLNDMDKFSNLIYQLHSVKEYGSGKDDNKAKYYNLLTTNLSMLQGLLKEYGSRGNLARAYGISNLVYTVNNDIVKIYIPKGEYSADIRQLSKELDATISEYYGIVQFDGTEPEARGEYVFDYNIGVPVPDYHTNNQNDKSEEPTNDKSDNKENDSENNSEEKPKRTLIKIRKKDIEKEDKFDNDEDMNDENTEDDEESIENNSETEDDEDDDKEDNEEEDKEEEDDDEEEKDETDNSDEETELEDNDDTEDETEDEDNEEDESNEEPDDSNNDGKITRADFFKGVKDTDGEDTNDIEDEKEDEEDVDPDSVDDFFDDKEVEGNMEKKSDEIEKDLSKELDARIAKEKEEKEKIKERSKKLKKIKKIKEVTSVSNIPSSKIGTVDLMRSMATEPLVYDGNGFEDNTDYDIEKEIARYFKTLKKWKREKERKDKLKKNFDF